jgi:choloylglycine hydrolase
LAAAEEEENKSKTEGMRSSTIWTTADDTENLLMQYHTMHNRRVRQIDVKKIDFSGSKELIRIPLDREKIQDIEDVTPEQ